MNRRKRRRLMIVAALLIGAGGASALAIAALQDNVLYFYSPSDVLAKHVAPGVAFRVGGLVKEKSVKREAGATLEFVVTDGRHDIPVEFTGDVPALFREGQGVVAIGRLNDKNVFKADQVLAKHDEKYMPPEVVDALKRSGHWDEGKQ